jgi:TRAP-type C4-dicarboxylate transport system substrate-binding protein
MTRSFFALPALMFFAGVAPSVAAQPVVWDLANEYPATSLAGEGDVYFARLVEQRTAGRLRIVTYFDGRLGYKSREQLQAVAGGKAAMADSFAGALGEADPVFLLSSLPLLTPTVADARRLFDVARDSYERALAAHNQKLLFVSPWPPAGIWAKQPVTSFNALRSLNIRTYDKTSVEVMQGAGAQAINLSFAEVVAKLKAEQINAVLSSGDGGAGRALWDYLNCFTVINYAIPLSLATVNLDAWNALDPAAREVVKAAADETMARQWQRMEGRVEENYQRMRENGMTIVTEVPEDVRDALAKASKAAIEEWVKKMGDEGRVLLERFRVKSLPLPRGRIKVGACYREFEFG